MAHNASERSREIRRRRAKRTKLLKLRKDYAMAKSDDARSMIARKIEALGAQVPVS